MVAETRHAALARLAAAAVEFMTTVAPGRPAITSLSVGSVLLDGFHPGVGAQLGIFSPGNELAAVAEYAEVFGSLVVFQDAPTDDEFVHVYTVGEVAGVLVKVWDYIPRGAAHRLAVQLGQVPVLREADPSALGMGAGGPA